MIAWRSWTSLVTVAVMAHGVALSAHAQPYWEQEMRDQAKIELNCDVQFINEVTEQDIDDRRVVFAKIHCADGRAFDANRMDEFDPFEFRECKVDVC